MDSMHGDPLRRVEDVPDDRTATRRAPAPSREAQAEGERLAGRTIPADAAQSQVVLGDGTAEGSPDSPVQGATFAELDLGGTESHQRASFSDPVAPDEVPGELPRPDER